MPLNEYDELLSGGNPINEYDSVAQEMQGETRQNLKQSMTVASGMSPDQSARILELSKSAKLPANFIAGRENEVAKQQKLSQFENEYDSLIAETPGLAKYLQDPEKAAVVQDDLDSLKKIEKAARSQSYAGDLGNAFVYGTLKLLSGLSKVPRAFESDQPEPAGRPSDFLGTIYGTPEQVKKRQKYLDEQAKKFEPQDIGESIVSNARAGEYKTAARSLSLQVAAAVPQLGMVAISRGYGLRAMFLSSFGNKLDENLDKGIDRETALANAALTGGVETAIESIGGIGADPLKQTVKRVVKELGPTAAKEIFKEGVYQVIKTSGVEGAEEFVTSVTQDLIDYGMDVNPDALDNIGQRAVDSFLVGAGAGGGVGSVQQSIEGTRLYRGIPDSVINGQQQLIQAEVSKETYLEIGDAVEQSKTSKRSQIAQKEFLEESTKGTQVENIYIAPKDMDAYFQTKGQTGVRAAQELGFLEKYNQAKESDTEIEIPFAEWIDKVGKTEHYKGLADDVKFNIETQTPRQSKQSQKETAEDLRKQEQAARQRLEARENDKKIVYNKIKDQLRESGYSDSEAGKNAEIASRQFSTLAERSGQTAEGLYNQYGLKIQSVDAAPQMTAKGQMIYRQDGTPAPVISPLGFYSQVDAEITKMDFKQVPAKDLLGRIKNLPGIKKDELDTLGLEEFLNAQDGKVTKEQVIDFIRANNPVVQQVVLGGDAGSTKERGWSEQEFIPLSEYDNNFYWEAVNDEVYNRMSDSYWLKEEMDELRPSMVEEFTDEDGNIDEDGLETAMKEAIEKNQQEFAEEHVDSEDYFNARYKVTEQESGFDLIGNDDSGWYSLDLGQRFDGNLEEAKIQMTQKMIKNGDIEADLSDFIKESDVEFRHLRAEVPSDKTIKGKVKKLLESDGKRLTAKAKAEAPDWYLKDYTPEEYDKSIADDAESLARAEIIATYGDMNVKKNKITFRVDTAGLDASVSGNNVVGWTMTVDRGDDTEKIIKIDGKSKDELLVSVRKELLKLGKISKDAEVTQNMLDINKSEGKSKFDRYQVKGGGSNYRELLLTLPDVDGEFVKGSHFSQKNVFSHLRLTDRVNSKGQKVLFIEELQSDWHQQGREKGYIDPEKVSQLKSELTEVESQLEILSSEKENIKGDLVAKSLSDPNDVTSMDNKKYEELASSDPRLEEISIREMPLEERRKELGVLIRAERESVPDAPFKNTEVWASLAMKRALKMAVELGGYEAIAWTPAMVHTERWGTDSISWVKKTEGDQTYWLVGSVEQVGGNADDVNIEELARQRGELLERRGERVTSKEDLQKIIGDTLNRERNDRSLESLTENVWTQMQTVDSGVKAPRKEGFEFFYDNLLSKKVLPAILKKLDKQAKVEVDTFETTKFGQMKSWQVQITEEMKKSLEKGQSLFQVTNEDIRGQIRFGSDRQFNIDLFKMKDKSTFLHEFSHFSFEVMADLAAQDNATESLKADYQRLLDFAGVSDRSQVNVEVHEKIARAFEAYLMEGVAPDRSLRKTFNTFKTWLTEIYRSVRNLNVELTPEVRSVFDRLLVSEDEARTAMDLAEYDPLFADPAAMGMNDKQSADYIQAREDARLHVEENVRRRLMRDLKRQDAKFYKEKMKAIEDEVTVELKGSRPYRALFAIKNQVMPDGTPIEESLKINRASLEAIEPGASKIVPRGTTDSEGTHVEIVAQVLGYGSGTELFSELKDLPDLKAAIIAKTEQRMTEEYPDSLTDGTISDEAVLATYNDSRARMLRMELEYLAVYEPKVLREAIRRVARRVPTEEMVRDQADQIVGSLIVKDLRPDIYRRAEVKAAKEAGILLAKGDIDGAFEAKRKELLNFELYRSSMKAKDKVAKDLKDFKKLFKTDEDLAKTRDIDLVNAARSILSQFGITRADKGPLEYLGQMRAYDNDQYMVMSAIIESALQGAGPYKQVKYDDFAAMSDAVKALWDLSKDSKEIEIDGIKYQRDAITQEMSERLAEITPAETKEYNQAATTWDKAKMYLLGFRSSLRRVESWADALDGPKKTFQKFMVRPIIDATTAYRKDLKVTIKKYGEIVKNAKTSTWTAAEIDAPTLNYKFKNKAELVGALLHTGNKSNFQKLLVGRKWGTIDESGELDSSRWDEFMREMYRKGIVNEDDMDFVQAVWDLNESLKPAAQKAHKKMYGIYFNEITADPVKTPFGEYRGGYMPAVADPFLAQDANIRNEKDALLKENNSFMFPTTGRGFTKSRVEQYAAPLSLELGMVPGHIDKVLRFIHIEPTVKSIGRMVTDKKFRGDLDNFDPTVGGEMLVPWLQRAASQRVNTPSGTGRAWQGLDRFFTGLRTRTGLQVMVLNVTNTMQQITGLSLAAVKVKPRFLRNALWTHIKNPKKSNEMITEKSEYMDSVLGQSAGEIRATIDDMITNPSKYERAADFAKKHGYFLQTHAQNFVNQVTWIGAYDQATESGVSDAEAVKMADSAVRTTQGTLAPEDVSRFEVGSPFMRMFTQFYTYFNMQANLLGSEYIKTMRDLGLRKGAGRLTYLYVFGFMIPAVMAEVIVKAMSGQGFDEDDDDEYLDDAMSIFFGSQFRTGSAMVPIVGQTAGVAVNTFNNKWYDDRISTSPSISMIESAAKSPKSVYDSIQNGELSNKAIKDSMVLIGLLTGLPVAPLSRPISYTRDVMSGETQPEGPVDFARGFVTGKSQR